MTYISKNNHSSEEISIIGELEHKFLNRYQSNRHLIQFLNSIQMGFAETYLGGFEIEDRFLKSIFNTAISLFYRYFSSCLISHKWVLTESETLAENSQTLMKLQYNLPQKMFSAMLGEDDLLYPKYTMALWSKGATNLREAQLNMLEDTITKANIQDGDLVLDIGCGWGSAANYILHKFPNVQVTGLNLSHEQCKYIQDKIKDVKSHLSSDRFTLIEGDFNQVNFDKKFDKIISLGVFEHIGNLTESFKKISSFLKADGKVFIHIISIKLPHNIWNPFLDKYIFPRARVWHYDMIPSLNLKATRQPNRDLKTVEHWFINGSNYSKTLQAWLKNFDLNQDQIKGLNFGMDYARFRRMWRLYLLWCIAYFDSCQGEILGNGQYLMVHA